MLTPFFGKKKKAAENNPSAKQESAHAIRHPLSSAIMRLSPDFSRCQYLH